ncbi:MAG TPA: hypothetical protein VE010_20975 [Thermoanaerobaculia bacterium]|nr:hypothetical protein [Thermoanaerobaculia bacterium]
MKARVFAFAAAALLLTSGAFAQPAKRVTMDYTPISCIKGGELPLMQLNIAGEGELRSYFRRTNSTDWCSVEGTNDGPLSRVVLPKFDAGDEIEYFFVLIQGRRVVARSPHIYRVRVNAQCGVAFARHVQRLALSCGETAQGVPSAMGAGYALDDALVEGDPTYATPDRPVDQ